MTRSDFLPNPSVVTCVHCGRSISDPRTKCGNCRTFIHEKTCRECPHQGKDER